MFTKEYIEMVSKADEIQKLWKQKDGDWYVNKQDMRSTDIDEICIVGNQYIDSPGGVSIFGETSSSYSERCPMEGDKWLPTLDDLFEIWCNLGEATNFAGLCQRITDRKSKIIRYPNIKHIKELCLEAIMQEFYNKSWNPEKKEWEEIDGS